MIPVLRFAHACRQTGCGLNGNGEVGRPGLHGTRGIFSDPNMINGTMYAVSDRPEGPYHELADNVPVAARSAGPDRPGAGPREP
jgi:hypothetical protein